MHHCNTCFVFAVDKTQWFMWFLVVLCKKVFQPGDPEMWSSFKLRCTKHVTQKGGSELASSWAPVWLDWKWSADRKPMKEWTQTRPGLKWISVRSTFVKWHPPASSLIHVNVVKEEVQDLELKWIPVWTRIKNETVLNGALYNIWVLVQLCIFPQKRPE